MSEEQRNIDNGNRWQVDYEYNLVWDQTIKSQVNTDSLKRLFAYAEKCYDILEGSFENSEGPYYSIKIKSKEDWKSNPAMNIDLEKDFHEETNEYNIAFLTVQKDTRENGKKGNEKVVTSNLKDHTNSIKLRCQGNLYYEKLNNKIILARYSYEENEDINKSLYIAFPQEVIGNGQKSYRVTCRNLQRARKYGIYSDPSSELKEVIFTAENISVYFANREMLHGISRIERNDNPETSEEERLESTEKLEQHIFNRIIFGAPGTGKSHTLEEDSKQFGDNMERVTFHPNYSYANFVGAYKPVMEQNDFDWLIDEDKQKVISVLQDKSMPAQEKYDLLYDKFKDKDLTRLPLLLGIYTDESFKTKKIDGTDAVGDNGVERNHGKAIRPYLNLQSQKHKNEISYEYVPGPFMRIYVQAINHPEEDFLLLIEEINRANVAAVFGDVFQLLDRKNGISEYPIATSEDMKKYLIGNIDSLKGKNINELSNEEKEMFLEMRIPNNMYIWATMNSADQGVFPMDTAFKRRWEFEYIGIDKERKNVENYVIPMGMGENRYYIYWNELREGINSVLSKDENRVNEDKLLGPFFISKSVLDNMSKSLGDSKAEDAFIKAFESKVIMYLFEDVMKMRPEKIFIGCKEKKLFSKICEAFETDGEKIFGLDDIKPVQIEPISDDTQE